MKKIFKFLLFVLLSNQAKAQFPINEPFNPPLTWATTNGAGVQNYGGAENYATTNVGTTPYPNNSTVTITSPLYNLSNCGVSVVVSFPISGVVENGFDFMYFEYTINGSTWITVQTFTGNQNSTPMYTIPQTAIRFRFRLVTDATVNSYNIGINNYVYYYDIRWFNISCPSGLSAEYIQLASEENILKFESLGPFSNFQLFYSRTGYDFQNIGSVTNGMLAPFSGYYKIVGLKESGNVESNTVAVLPDKERTILKICNLSGQEVDEYYEGVIIIYYTDGTVEKHG